MQTHFIMWKGSALDMDNDWMHTEKANASLDSLAQHHRGGEPPHENPNSKTHLIKKMIEY